MAVGLLGEDGLSRPTKARQMPMATRTQAVMVANAFTPRTVQTRYDET